jgi:hypothetical protein
MKKILLAVALAGSAAVAAVAPAAGAASPAAAPVAARAAEAQPVATREPGSATTDPGIAPGLRCRVPATAGRAAYASLSGWGWTDIRLRNRLVRDGGCTVVLDIAACYNGQPHVVQVTYSGTDRWIRTRLLPGVCRPRS